MIQADLLCIRDLYMEEWDGDRIVLFARNLAILSMQLEDGLPKYEATILMEADLEKVLLKKGDLEKALLSWAQLHACLRRMEVRALQRLWMEIGSWHLILREDLSQEKIAVDGRSKGEKLYFKNNGLVGCCSKESDTYSWYWLEGLKLKMPSAPNHYVSAENLNRTIEQIWDRLQGVESRLPAVRLDEA